MVGYGQVMRYGGNSGGLVIEVVVYSVHLVNKYQLLVAEVLHIERDLKYMVISFADWLWSLIAMVPRLEIAPNMLVHTNFAEVHTRAYIHHTMCYGCVCTCVEVMAKVVAALSW